MARRHVWPEGHWAWPIAVTHKHGLRDGEMVFVGGQVDLDPDGNTLHPDALDAQSEAAVDHIETVLGLLDADVEDVVKVVAFYVDRGEVDEARFLARLRRRFSGNPPPALAAVPLPTLAYPGLAVEIEVIAMRGAGGARLARSASNPASHWEWPFSHGLRCGECIFVGTQMPLDPDGRAVEPGRATPQAHANIENLRLVLAGFGADLADVCRLNTFYLGHGTTADWAEAGRIRGNAFEWPGPVGTGVPVPAQFPPGVTQRQEAVAMRGIDGARLSRIALRPEGHWDWPVPVNFQQVVRVGRMVFVGGQVSAKGKGEVLHPHDMEAQTRETLANIERCLAAVGAQRDDVVKVNTFYKGGASYDQLHRNLSIRSAFFSDPGPTTTGVPLANLGLEAMEIEIEMYAMVDDQV